MEAVVPLARVQRQELVDEVTCVLILHIGLKPLLNSALAAAWDLELLKEVKSGNPWPHLVDLSIRQGSLKVPKMEFFFYKSSYLRCEFFYKYAKLSFFYKKR